MNTKSIVWCSLGAVGVTALLVAASCAEKQGSQAQQSTEPPAEVQKYLRQVEEAQAKRAAIEAEYKAMPVAELAKRLEADSTRDVEPFNSLAYREVVSRGSSVSRELASFIKAPDRSSFLTLMALRTVDKEVYNSIEAQTRAAILVDALRTSQYFNTWGLPHLYWEEAAKALIELGDVAVEPLTGLLQETQAAPVWGSEEVMEYKRYNYRVKDYAWALLMEIRGRKGDIPVDPTARDQLISAVKG